MKQVSSSSGHEHIEQDFRDGSAQSSAAPRVPVLLNNWEGQTVKDVFTEFDGTRWSAYRDDDAIPVEEKPEFKGAEILLASYGTPSYEGYAFVLFQRDGSLYEVNGGHCSCYGLEGQWDPEETTVEALRHRITDGTLGKGDYDENPFAQELLEVLNSMRPEPVAQPANIDSVPGSPAR